MFSVSRVNDVQNCDCPLWRRCSDRGMRIYAETHMQVSQQIANGAVQSRLVQRCIASTECEWCRFHDDTRTERQLLPCTDACGLSRGGATAAWAMPKPPSTKRPLQEYSRNVSITRLLHRIVVWRWSDASRIEDRQLLFCVCMHG